MSIVITKKVVNLSPSQWVNKDEQGQEVLGKRNIQVQLQGGYSFRSTEGDDMFADILDYVRIGTEVVVKCSGISPAPYQSAQTTSSGEEVQVTNYFMNLQDVELEDMREPERNPKFEGKKKHDHGDIVFTHREGRQRRTRRSESPETLPEGAGETTSY